MQTATRHKLSKWALAFTIIAAICCTLLLLGSLMGDPYPGMSPAEKARDTQIKHMAGVYFQVSWLVVFAVAVFMRWQKWLWKAENGGANVG